MIIVVMGVSGCGKSTIGKRLAELIGGGFAEGDAYHPPANVAKMARGEPLNDDDREPWLRAMAADIGAWHREGKNMVLACSALKNRYRDILRADHAGLIFVYLKGAKELIAGRLAARQNHFMPPALLDSQFATLEEPSDAIAVAIDQPVEDAARQAAAALRAG